MKNCMDSEEKLSHSIDVFLKDNKKRCLWIAGSNPRNIKNILPKFRTKYDFTDLFYNVKDETDLLFLIRQQKNPNKRTLEYDEFLNPIGLFNFSKIATATFNLFKSDIASFSKQIIKELKSINSSRLCILIDCSKDLSERLTYAIREICMCNSIETKFILIGPNDIYSQIFLKSAEYLQFISVEFPLEYFSALFPKLKYEHIKSLRIATNDNIQEMQYLYNYLINNANFDISSNDLLQSIVETGLKQSYDSETLNIFSIAAHVVDKFSINELEDIIINEMHNNIIVEAIENTVANGVDNGIIQELPANAYEFVISIVKNALQNIRNRQAYRIHIAIESYLSKKSPFSYDLRFYHLEKANSNKKDLIIAMKFFNKLHFGKFMDEETESRFIELYGETVAKSIENAYKSYNEGDYNNILKETSKISISNNVVIQTEIKYLELFVIWKTLDKSNAYKVLDAKFNDIYASNCETETKIFTKLLQLSIVSNESDYILNNSPTPLQLYQEISGLLKGYDGIDAQYLLNVLRRKSNCALSRAMAIVQIQASFEYFSKCKEFYPYEYLYAGNNYLALLLQSFTSNEQLPLFSKMMDAEIHTSRNAFYVAKLLKDEAIDNSEIKAYIMNNYLIAKSMLHKEEVEEQELIEFGKLIQNVSSDSHIMFNMNLGTFYALQNKFDLAKKYLKIAQNANAEHDIYFDYIIKNNLFIIDLINGRDIIQPYTSIPMLLCNDTEIMAYFNQRNNILKSLKDNEVKFQSIQEIECYFNDEFSKLYNNMQLRMWSSPFILSDVQFWSNN